MTAIILICGGSLAVGLGSLFAMMRYFMWRNRREEAGERARQEAIMSAIDAAMPRLNELLKVGVELHSAVVGADEPTEATDAQTRYQTDEDKALQNCLLFGNDSDMFNVSGLKE